CRFVGRQPDREPRSFTGFTLDRDRAAVQFREQLDHGQAQARALELARQPAVHLAEWREQQIHALGRDADTVVGDGNPDELRDVRIGCVETPALPVTGQLSNILLRDPRCLQYDLPAFVAELHGVRQQVVYDLLHLALVQLDLAEVRRRL